MEETKEVSTVVDEDQRKLFVGGLAQVSICPLLTSNVGIDKTIPHFLDTARTLIWISLRNRSILLGGEGY